MARTYHCISFVLQLFGLLYVVFHWMWSELGMEKRRKKDKVKGRGN